MISSKASAVSQKLEYIFKEVHWSHDVFILRTKRKQCNEKMWSVPATVKEMRRDIQLTFWQQSMNSSMVTTPSLFLSIFCWRGGEKGKAEKQIWGGISKASLLWLAFTAQWMLLKTHLPERKLLRADEASPLWGRGMCTFPSCRRWPSWCPAFPAIYRKRSV